jgi:type VII secretion protein EccB
MLPSAPEQRIDAAWSVCDKTDLDKSLNDPNAKGTFKTTVLAGVSGGGQALDGNKALLVKAGTDDKKAYLIYKAPENSRITSTSTVRAAVDLTKSEVVSALRLGGKDVRAVSAGLLNAIPEVSPLKAPEIENKGTAVDYMPGVNGVKVGDVIQAERTGEGEVFYVALKDGLQEVGRGVADLIRFANSGDVKPKQVDLSKLPQASKPSAPLEINDYPREVPQLLDVNQNNVVVCLGWRADNPFSSNKSEHTQVTVSNALPIPAEAVPVDINQVGATGEVVSQFVMAAGKAGVVRSSTSTEDFERGPIQLITGRGVKYGVPDTITSGALGLGQDKFTPAPDSILRLLPSGPQLNRNDAARSYDSIPMPKGAGLLPEESAKKTSGG